MGHRAFPFRFRVLRISGDVELVYLPKLGEADVVELTARLASKGYGNPKVINSHPKIIRYASESSSLRLMPRGLLLAAHGAFERLGPVFDFPLKGAPAPMPALSWEDNDFQQLFPTAGGLTYVSRGRHAPPRNRFAGEVSRTGPVVSADELYMVFATAEACNSAVRAAAR